LGRSEGQSDDTGIARHGHDQAPVASRNRDVLDNVVIPVPLDQDERKADFGKVQGQAERQRLGRKPTGSFAAGQTHIRPFKEPEALPSLGHSFMSMHRVAAILLSSWPGQPHFADRIAVWQRTRCVELHIDAFNSLTVS
jgi:hypothetical protein